MIQGDAIACMSETMHELPYEGAKRMLLVDNVDSKDYLTCLFDTMNYLHLKKRSK